VWDLVGQVVVLLLLWLISLYSSAMFEIMAAVSLAFYVLLGVTPCYFVATFLTIVFLHLHGQDVKDCLTLNLKVSQHDLSP
jgi:hypothetical protein